MKMSAMPTRLVVLTSLVATLICEELIQESRYDYPQFKVDVQT